MVLGPQICSYTLKRKYGSYVGHIYAFLVKLLVTNQNRFQEEHPASKHLSNRVLVWLSVRIEMNMTCIWSS